LIARGHACAVLVPDHAVVADTREAAFQVMGFSDTMRLGVNWTDGGATDLIHVFSPREHVRKMALALQAQSDAAVVVHMEDNEEQIVADQTGLPYAALRELSDEELERRVHPMLSHPRRYRQFIEQAQGYTCLIDRLLEFKPEGVPGVVFWPGSDKRFLSIDGTDPALRHRHGLSATDILIFYSGNIHGSNFSEVKELYLAVALLRQRGYPVRLVKTGRSGESLGFPTDGLAVDLGFVPRSEVPKLLSMCDILVQPGTSSPFNDYRFPAKLPEYLASGRPVILPDTNIGRELEDGRDVLKLASGSSSDIADKVERLIKEPALARKLGVNARNFARQHLSWHQAVDTLEPFYAKVLQGAATDGRPRRDQPIARTLPAESN
jgi:hypothetical protein